jgi:uncharacterized protein YcaQ
MEITREQIKLIQLETLGLLTAVSKKAEKGDVIRAIRKMGLLQIDTIHVVARSPYFVLWSRIGEYPQKWLDETHAEGGLFEYWAHAACFIPIEQYPLFRPIMTTMQPGWRNSDLWREEHRQTVEHVLARIKENGPTRSADFENKGDKKNGWWDWKEEKVALEHLWGRGELMIAYRDKFQRVYDLPEKVLPGYLDQELTYETSVRDQIERSIQVLGAARLKWISDYYRISKTTTAKVVKELLAANKILTFNSKEWNEEIYIHPSNADLLENALSNQLKPTRTTLLSPFDPLIWDRQRALELFDFDFSIECYLPASKRKFGYFNLPILYNGNLVGRLDAKANRQQKTFELKSIHFEDGFKLNSQFKNKFCKMLKSCADWHKTPLFSFSETIPENLKRFLEPLLAQE